jgi:ribose 5-phosphate isomerase B
MMKIFIGADHNGYDLKQKVTEYIRKKGIDVVDEGDTERDPDDDFPIFAQRVVTAILGSQDDEPRGILICGSGQGMMMAANRFNGIRAGLGYSKGSAMSIRNDEDSNVLAIPSEILDKDKDWKEVIDTWLSTPFAHAPRYKRRNKQLDEIN